MAVLPPVSGVGIDCYGSAAPLVPPLSDSDSVSESRTQQQLLDTLMAAVNRNAKNVAEVAGLTVTHSAMSIKHMPCSIYMPCSVYSVYMRRVGYYS